MDTEAMTTSNKKLWLDDVRPPPDEHWDVATTAPQAIEMLRLRAYDEVSLDHDLGPEEAGTGYDVICWIEERAMTDEAFDVPSVTVHTSNPSVLIKMMQAIYNCEEVEIFKKMKASRDDT